MILIIRKLLNRRFTLNWGIKFFSIDRGGTTKSGYDGLGTELIGHLRGDTMAGGSDRCMIWSTRSDTSTTTTLVSARSMETSATVNMTDVGCNSVVDGTNGMLNMYSTVKDCRQG